MFRRNRMADEGASAVDPSDSTQVEDPAVDENPTAQDDLTDGLAVARRTGGVRPAMSPAARPLDARSPAAMDIPARRADPIPAAPSPVSSEKTTGRILTVGPEIELEGKISSCDRLIVEGKVKAEQSEIKYIDVAPGGGFQGSAMVEEADISGTFDGDLVATTRVTVHPGGRINGNVTYGKIIIEDGGIVVGMLTTANP
ncbi:MAG: bactofilin family protein [Magnetospiraceae bacterium]